MDNTTHDELLEQFTAAHRVVCDQLSMHYWLVSDPSYYIRDPELDQPTVAETELRVYMQFYNQTIKRPNHPLANVLPDEAWYARLRKNFHALFVAAHHLYWFREYGYDEMLLKKLQQRSYPNPVGLAL
jgi:hypothetical protein